ncbi:hypothetical protein OMR07_14570 [Methylobacterium organophilum]|nr:hypothetical protein [Methylobacterium organophilum]
MRKVLVTLALLGTLAAPEAARAQSRTTLGVGSGAAPTRTTSTGATSRPSTPSC